MATKYILKRKYFGITTPFLKTRMNYNAARNAFKAGNTSEAMKLGAKSLGRATIGATKIAAGTAAGAAALSAKPIFDKFTGEDVNSSDGGLY